MSDAIRLKLPQRAPDGIRSQGLSGMHGQAQPVLRGVLIDVAELLRCGAALIPANSDARDVALLEANCLFNHTARFVHAEVPDRVEDPVQRHAKFALAALSPTLCSFKQRGKFLPA